MPSKKPVQEVDLIDAITFLRMDNEARELVELAHYGRSTPISGDAITVYSEMFTEGVAQTPKVHNNDGMDNNITFTTGPKFNSPRFGFSFIPESVEVTFHDSDYIALFVWDERVGAYLDEEGNALTVTRDADLNVVSIEVPESM